MIIINAYCLRFDISRDIISITCQATIIEASNTGFIYTLINSDTCNQTCHTYHQGVNEPPSKVSMIIMQDESNKPGKFVTIPPETIESMRVDRQGGMTLKQISDKYQISVNSVRKYTDDIIKPRATALQGDINNIHDINQGINKTVLEKHAGNILAYSKKRDAEVVAAGEAVQQHLAEKGINVDIDQIPPAQLIKLLKSPLGDDMNPNVKNIFDQWLEQQLNNVKTPAVAAPDKISFSDVKEIMMLKLFTKMTGDDEGSNKGAQSTMQEMRAENEKQRQFYEQKLKEHDDKLREIIFEKKIQTLEETNTQTTNGLANQLAEISQRIELYRTPPPNPTPEQAKDAITHIEDLGKQVSRIKSAFGELGIVTSAPGAAPTPDPAGIEAFRDPDGTVNKGMFIINKLADTAGKAIDAWQKPKPEFKNLDDTLAPMMEGFKLGQGDLTIQTTQKISPDDYYKFLLSKQQLTADEMQWIKLNKHAAPVTAEPPITQPPQAPPQQDFFDLVHKNKAIRQKHPEKAQPLPEQTLAREGEPGVMPRMGVIPEVEPAPASPAEPEKLDIVERLKQQEAEDILRAEKEGL